MLDHDQINYSLQVIPQTALEVLSALWPCERAPSSALFSSQDPYNYEPCFKHIPYPLPHDSPCYTSYQLQDAL